MPVKPAFLFGKERRGDIGQKELLKTAVAVEKSMATAVQSFLREV